MQQQATSQPLTIRAKLVGWAIFWSVFLLAFNGFAQTTRVYFVGNSFTATYDVPGLFTSLSASGGHTVQTGADIIGGSALTDHWATGVATNAIAGGGYNYVVLQELSTLAYDATVQAGFSATAPLFHRVSTNSGAQTVLYMTWVRETQLATLDNGIAIYRSMAAQLNCKDSPVGVAWKRVMEQNPSLDLYDADRHHPNQKGAYLAACCFYGAIFNQSPESLSFRTVGGLVLDAAEAALLQRIAWDAVQFVAFTNPPVVTMSVDQTVRTNSTPFVFQATASDNGSVTNYLWSFGDGTSTNGPALTNVTHAYATDGVFPVTVKVTDNANESERTGLYVTRDTTGPQVSAVVATSTELTITFNQDIQQAGAETATNYTVSGGINVAGASRIAPNVVRLTVSALSAGVEYVLTLNNLYSTLGVKIIPNSTRTFTYIDGSNLHLRFDFGNNTYPTPGNWNNVTNTTVLGLEVANAIDIYGVQRTIGIGLFQKAATVAYSTDPIASNLYPATAQRDCIYSTKQFSYKIEGADPASQYRLTIFGSKSATIRETLYSVGTNSVVLDCAYNSNRVAIINGVKSDANGEIIFNVAPNVVNSSGFAYLSVLELEDTTPVIRNIETSTNSLSINEGGTNSFQARLSSPPAGEVTISINRLVGDVQVSPITSFLVFTTNNWHAWQTIYVQATQDGDTNNGVATLRCADVGGIYTLADVTATQIDNTVVAPATDNDGDGLPNSWETQYFGGATNATPTALAANGRNTVWEAYVAGLNPTNPQSFFTCSGQMSGTLQWGAVTGRVYSVYWSSNLAGVFQPIATNLVWPQNSWTDQVHAVQSSRFYRISVRMEP